MCRGRGVSVGGLGGIDPSPHLGQGLLLELRQTVGGLLGIQRSEPEEKEGGRGGVTSLTQNNYRL